VLARSAPQGGPSRGGTFQVPTPATAVVSTLRITLS